MNTVKQIDANLEIIGAKLNGIMIFAKDAAQMADCIIGLEQTRELVKSLASEVAQANNSCGKEETTDDNA